MAIVSDVEIRLRADIARLQQDMNRVRSSVDSTMNQVTRAANAARSALAGITAGLGFGELVRMTDNYTKYVAQLKLATDSTRAFATANADVKRIAASSQQDLQSVGVLYARITNATAELGVTQRQVAQVTEAVSASLVVSGATASEAASATLQLSQAFGSGVLRGEEFNAVNEAAPRLMKALADGIGVPVGALRKMAEEGLITSDVMARVLPKSLEKLREEAAQVSTISGGFTVLKNAVTEFVGVNATASGSVAAVAGLLTALANNLHLVAGALLTVVAVKFANFLDAAIARTAASVTANNALIASNLAAAKSELDAALAADVLAGARLNEVRTATLASAGNVQLALTTNGLIPAQANAARTSAALSAAFFGYGAAASAAAVGTRALNAALAFTGGPIGLIVTVLGAAATAWGIYEYAQQKANDKAAADTEASASEITANLEKQNNKLRERIKLQQQAGASQALTMNSAGADKLAETLKDINELKAKGATLDAADQIRLISLQGIYNGLNRELEANLALKRQEEANGQAAKALTDVRERLNGVNGQYLKDLSLLQTALARGAIDQAEYTELVSKLAKETYASSDAGRAGAAAAKEAATNARQQADAYRDLLRVAQDRAEATAREAEGLAPLTAAEQSHLDLTRQISDGKIKLTKEQEKRVRSLIDEAGANEVLKRSNKEFNDLQQKLIDNASELAKARQSAIEAARTEAEQNEFLVKTFGMAEDAVMRLQAARLLEQEAQRLGRDLTQEEVEDLQKVIELKERSAKAVATKRELEEAKQFWIDIDKTARDTFVSIADGGKNAFQRLKDTAKNVFFDWLYQQTLKKWIINIQANSGGTGGILQALGGSSSSSSGGGMGNISNLLSIGKTIYSGFSTGLAGSLGSTISSLGSMFGSQAVSGFGAGLTGSSLGASTALGSSGYAGTAAAGAGASAGAYAIPIAGWIAAGMTVANNLYKQGWDATNGTLNTAGKVFGSSILAFNSVLKKIGLSSTAANIFSGQATLSKLFGRKNPEIEASGIQGTFNAAGFTGQNFANILEKGGWFRSDKRYSRSADLTAEQQSGFSNTITSILDAARGFGSALGAEVSVLNSYSKQIKLTLTKDEAENEKLIAGLFAGIGDELAVMLVPTIARFSAEGETAAATLERVANNFLAIDAVLDVLGVTSQTAFRAVGVASIEARERLIAATGGLEAFAAQVEFFNQNFLSAAEQVAPLQRQVNEQLAVLGYSSVKTADQFKAAVQGLVQSGALATAEGAKTYAALLALAPAFKTVTDYLNEVNEAARQSLRSRVDTGLSALERAVSDEKDTVSQTYESLMDRLGVGIDSLGDSISRATDLSRALKSSLVGVDAPGQLAGMRAAAQAQVQGAIDAVRTGGALPSTEDLQDALAALQQDASGQFSSLADYQREVARTNNQLNELGGLTDEQLSTAERQLKTLQEQRDQAARAHEAELMRLDNIVLAAQNELSLINGVNPAILTVTEAVMRVDATLRELRTVTPGAIGPGIDTIPPLFEVRGADSQIASTNEALLAEMRAMNARLAAIEDSNQQTANAARQQADQFNQVSGGGNALVVESA